MLPLVGVGACRLICLPIMDHFKVRMLTSTKYNGKIDKKPFDIYNVYFLAYEKNDKKTSDILQWKFPKMKILNILF